MRFSSKLALIAGGSLLALALISSWSYSQFFHNRAKDQLRGHLMSEGLSAKKLAESEVELLTQKLILLLSEESALRKLPNPGPNRAFMDSDFVEIAIMNLESGQKYQADWASMRPGYASRWESGSHLKLLETLPFEQVGSDFHVFHSLKSPEGQPLFALLIPLAAAEGNNAPTKIGVGFVTATTFANVVDPFRRAGKEAGLLDESGVALAYTSQQYVGTSLAKHPVVNEVLKNLGAPVEAGEDNNKIATNLAGNEVLFSFERLGNSNLLVFVSQEPLSPMGFFGRSTLNILGYALALMLILGGILIWLFRPFENAFNYLQDLVISLSERLPVREPEEVGSHLQNISEPLEKLRTQGVPAVTAASAAPQLSAEKLAQTQDEARLKAYQEISAGLSQALKGPVSAILGHAQLARSKARDESVKEHFSNIEKEARKSRDTLENLLKISGDSRQEHRQVDVRESMNRALSRMQSEISKSGIKLKKDLKAGGVIMANPGQLDTVFEELIRNAMESMTLSHPKELEVVSEERGDKVVFEISDTGAGMSEDTLKKAFDPFFTTKTLEEKDGLGLNVVRNLISAVGVYINHKSE